MTNCLSNTKLFWQYWETQAVSMQSPHLVYCLVPNTVMLFNIMTEFQNIKYAQSRYMELWSLWNGHGTSVKKNVQYLKKNQAPWGTSSWIFIVENGENTPSSLTWIPWNTQGCIINYFFWAYRKATRGGALDLLINNTLKYTAFKR